MLLGKALIIAYPIVYAISLQLLWYTGVNSWDMDIYFSFFFKFWFIHLLGDKKEKRPKIAYHAVQEIYLQPNIIWS